MVGFRLFETHQIFRVSFNFIYAFYFELCYIYLQLRCRTYHCVYALYQPCTFFLFLIVVYCFIFYIFTAYTLHVSEIKIWSFNFAFLFTETANSKKETSHVTSQQIQDGC